MAFGPATLATVRCCRRRRFIPQKEHGAIRLFVTEQSHLSAMPLVVACHAIQVLHSDYH